MWADGLPQPGARLGVRFLPSRRADSTLWGAQLARLEALQQQVESLGLSCAEDDGELEELSSAASPAKTPSG